MKKNRKIGGLYSWIKKATLVDWLIIGGIAVAAVVVIVLCVVLFGGLNGSSNSGSGSASGSGSGVVSNPNADKDYDKDTNTINKNEYSETILEKASDAGQEYIDDTLFIGDSNTVRMMSYGHTTLSNDVGAVSMGIQHVASKPIVFFVGTEDAVTVPKAVQIIQPKRIVITYGTNNTIGWTTKTFTDEYKKALQSITKAYPYADIIINSIPPVDKIRENPNVTMQTIDAFNSALAKMAKAEGYKFLNSAEVLKDEKHGFAKTDYTISDGIHFSKKGMDALFDYIRTHPYEAEDKRPKPLKKVPARKETPPGIITEDPIFDRTQKKGIQVQFINETPDMGAIEGKTDQTVEEGKTCEAVTAMPLEGYALSFWSCTVGRIDSVSALTLNFVVPASKEKILVAARFEKAHLTLSDANGAVSSISLETGKAFKPTVGFAPASYSHSKDFVVASDNAAVATVAADGTITAVGAGSCNISFSALSGKLTNSIAVTVSSKQIALADVTVTGSLSIETGKTGQIAVTYSPADATNKPAASFASDNTGIATVNSSGVVTGVSAGTANITVTVGSFVKKCTVSVNNPAPADIPATGFSIPGALTLNVGESGKITVTYVPGNATIKPAATFSSDNAAVVTVDGSGNVTAVAGGTGGTANISVAVDGLGTQTCVVTVAAPTPPISSTPSSSVAPAP